MNPSKKFPTKQVAFKSAGKIRNPPPSGHAARKVIDGDSAAIKEPPAASGVGNSNPKGSESDMDVDVDENSTDGGDDSTDGLGSVLGAVSENETVLGVVVKTDNGRERGG